MPWRPLPRAGRGGVEADAVVPHLEDEAAVAGGQPDGGSARLGVLRDVLERLETAEVHGRLDVLPVAPDPVGLDRDRDRRLARLRGERRAEPLVGEQRRVDAPRQVPKGLERVLRVRPDLGQHRLHALGVAVDEALREALLDGERDELLLGSVVQVAFERLRALVLCRDDAPARLAELLDQPNVAEHEGRLRRDVAEQPLAVGRERLGGRRHDRDRAEQLRSVPDRERPLRLGERRQLRSRGRDRGPVAVDRP